MLATSVANRLTADVGSYLLEVFQAVSVIRTHGRNVNCASTVIKENKLHKCKSYYNVPKIIGQLCATNLMSGSFNKLQLSNSLSMYLNVIFCNKIK